MHWTTKPGQPSASTTERESSARLGPHIDLTFNRLVRTSFCRRRCLSEVAVVRPGLADSLPVFEDQLEAMLGFPGDLSLKREIGASPFPVNIAEVPGGFLMREADVLPDVRRV